MCHAGPPACPDDERARTDDRKAGVRPQPDHGARYDAACGVYQRIESGPGESPVRSPIQTARADAASAPTERTPFVVQAGQTLFLVAEERGDWVLAELRFDPDTCTFVEDRRIRFQWPREVYGRFLSRATVGDDVDLNEANRVADAFTRWMASQFVTVQR